MLWILLAAIVGSTIAIAYVVWRKWIAPWRTIEGLVRQVSRGEQPRTFLIEGGNEAQRVSIALEEILSRQSEVHRQSGERTSVQDEVCYAMRDWYLEVDGTDC